MGCGVGVSVGVGVGMLRGWRRIYADETGKQS